ncbi:hypothetical protein ACT3CD_15200 [Geofilum sp. OHC36d9]|uniref:hypothetical protein n=1 Tax=Geofilum sp. OHC36d9 TaxID=3458413 RepID=UPI0040348483
MIFNASNVYNDYQDTDTIKMTKDNNIWKQEQLFKVPEGYFEKFELQLKNRIAPPKTTAPFSFAIVKPWLGLAAAFLVITLIYNVVTKDIIPTKDVINFESAIFEDISPADLFSEQEMVEYLLSKEQETTDIELYPDSLFFGDITDDDYDLLSLIEN